FPILRIIGATGVLGNTIGPGFAWTHACVPCGSGAEFRAWNVRPGVLFGTRTSSLMKGPRSFDNQAPGSEGGPKSVARRDDGTGSGLPGSLWTDGSCGTVPA